MRRPRFLVIAALLAAAMTPASAAASWAPDSCDRPSRTREPFKTLIKTRQMIAAADSARAIVDAWSARPGVDSLTLACAMLDHVSLALGVAHDRAAVDAQMRRALAIANASVAPDSLFLLRARYVEGEWHRIRSRPREADSVLHVTLAMMERRLPVDHIDLPAVLFGIATLRQQQGRASGLPYIERAIRIQELRMGPKDLGTAFARYQMAAQLLANGDPARARAEGERAIAVIRRAFGEKHPDLPRYSRALGILALNDGDYSSARRHLEEAFELTLAHSPVDSFSLARNHAAIAELRNDVGDHEGALESSLESMRLQRGRIEFGDPMYAKPFLQAGRALAALGAPLEANACLDSAFASSKGDSTLTSYTVLARAYAVRAAGDTAAALEWARQARERGRASHEPIDAYQAEAARFLADCLVDAGRPREVVEELGAAIDVVSARYGSTHPAVTRMRMTHVRALAAARDPRASAAALALAAQRREDLLALAAGFSEREALSVARRDGLGWDALLSLAGEGRLSPAERRDALAAVASARGLVLETIAARTRESRRSGGAAARIALDSLDFARAELARAMVREPTALIQPDSAMRASRAAVARWERQLADATGEGVLVPPVEADRLLAGLSPEEALVSYVVHGTLAARTPSAPNEQVVAFVARPGRDVEVLRIADAASLSAVVERWRREAAPGGTLREARSAGEALRRIAWDPLAALIAGASRVHVVSDGPLHLVDFSVLPGRRGGWLVEGGPSISRLSSERDLVTASRAPRGEPLVVGAPDFDRSEGPLLAAGAFRGARSGCLRFAELRFEPLPGARAEGERVVRHHSEAGRAPTWLTEGAATEAAFKAAAERASALHVATHGFFLGEACGAAAGQRGVGRLVAAAAPRRKRAAPIRPDVYLPERIGAAREHPLRLAGLALAGANRRADAAPDAEDGILTSEEVAALDLSGAGEVVLSACDTGSGDIAVGEGVFGLQRAFRLAGAGSLVMSLWPVRDADASAWMEAYYDARGRSVGVAEAVRAASRTRLAAIRDAGGDEHPSRWAGFIAVGR